jgi:hypothetical protein
LQHDLRRDADHVGVANLAALDDFHDGHARAELSRLRVHAQHAHIRFLKGVEHLGRGFFHRTRAEVLQD